MTLSRGRTRIAVLMDHLDHLQGGYATQVRSGLELACEERDADLLLFVGRELGVQPHSRVYDLAQEQCADGLIVLAAGLAALAGLKAVKALVDQRKHMPLCSLGVSMPGVPSVIADNRPGLLELLQHLILDHKKTRIAFLAGHEHNPDARTRLAVYKEALARHAIALDEELIVSDAFDPASGSRALSELLRRGVTFDAVVAVNDAAALGALEALREHKLRVPRDCALTGFDDLSLCRFTRPPLTTVRQPIAAMARAAVQLVCDQIDGLSVPLLTALPVEMVRRTSCGCNAGRSERIDRKQREPTDPLPWFREQRGRLAGLLESTLRPPSEHNWIEPLLQALESELDGANGAVIALLEDWVSADGDRDRAYDELQRGLALLREEFAGVDSGLEDLWSAAQRALGSANTADQVRQRMDLETSYTSLLRSAERLATALDLPALHAALASELPKLVRSAYVSLAVDDASHEFEAFFAMCDGVVQPRAQLRFAKTRLFPTQPALDGRRRTWFVLPLAFEVEALGIALVEMQPGVGIHEMLGTQISSALKGVALHREIVARTAQHERSVQERVATAKRMSALSVLAGGVAHDLNNALGPLVALPDVMLKELAELERGDPRSELETDITTIRAAALRAAQTIKDLLALGRQGRTQREPLDLNQLARACFEAESEMLERAACKGVCIALELTREPLIVTASEAQVVRAISNLLRNAIEAIEGEGHVSLTSEPVVLKEPLSSYETVEPGAYALLTVSDSGKGIAEADLGRVFEPFFTRKKLSDSSGSGLGLAIVHGVVKEHDGFTDIESKLGSGTSFRLYFPLVRELPERRRVQSVAPRGSARILVVDDDPVQLRTATRVLGGLGYEVTTAHTAARADEVFRRGWRRGVGSAYGLVLVDMLLNESVDGLMLFERFQEMAPGQRGIVVSGHAPSERVELAIERGLSFLAKPYTADELARAVRSALGTAEPAATYPSTSDRPSSSGNR